MMILACDGDLKEGERIHGPSLSPPLGAAMRERWILRWLTPAANNVRPQCGLLTRLPPNQRCPLPCVRATFGQVGHPGSLPSCSRDLALLFRGVPAPAGPVETQALRKTGDPFVQPKQRDGFVSFFSVFAAPRFLLHRPEPALIS